MPSSSLPTGIGPAWVAWYSLAATSSPAVGNLLVRSGVRWGVMEVVAVAPEDPPEHEPEPGRPASFDEVFVSHHARLVRLAGLLCGDRDEAEDVVADVFARTYRRWRTVPIEDPGAYLRRGVVNEVRSRWRRRDTRRRIDRAQRHEATVESPPADAGLGDQDRLRVALGRLPERQRAALVLRFYEDRSEAETAALLGVPTGTVKSTVSRGLERLQALLEEDG